MNLHQAATITRHRLNLWKARLEPLGATPHIMVSVGCTPDSAGQLFLSTTEDTPDERLIIFLRYALQELEKGQGGAPQNG